MTYKEIICDQTNRSIWSLKNIINCIDDEYWNKLYCDMPLWKHIYHTIHSIDRWYINPECYNEPIFHVDNLNNLDIHTTHTLTRDEIYNYLEEVTQKVSNYLLSMCDEELLHTPPKCKFTKFHLIMAQHRHLDMHIGMMMGFIIAETGKWPRVMGIDSEFNNDQPLYF